MRWALALSISIAAPACTSARSVDPAPVQIDTTPGTPADAPSTCDADIEATLARSPPWQESAFDKRRAEILGRARGEPMVFVREPAAPAMSVKDAQRRFAKRPRELREALLRDGYLFAETPDEARALSTSLTLPTLFDESEVHLSRGARVFALKRVVTQGRASYVHDDGATAEVLFGDRVATTPDALAAPLHRDFADFAEREGFLRVRPLTRGDGALVVEIMMGTTKARALVDTAGAKVSLVCVEARHAAAAEAMKTSTSKRRAALARLRGAVDVAVRQELPFDRPIGEKTAEKDGQRRPLWEAAYKRGADSFVAEGGTYPVFDAHGDPHPPEVCMEFIVDCFERAAGTWYQRRDEGARARVVRALDFDALGLKNRRGVLAFEAYARGVPDLFELRRFHGDERVPFGQYGAFVRGILELGAIEAGDIIAIHGLKRDGLVHQHGILVLRTDPVTGFPFDLADQMKRARRRTWDGIMAEAPLRSLLYRVRPGPKVLVDEPTL